VARRSASLNGLVKFERLSANSLGLSATGAWPSNAAGDGPNIVPNFLLLADVVRLSWLELLKQIAAATSRVMVMLNADNVANLSRLRVIEASAPLLGDSLSM
jgi:hypothetical protein